MQFSVLSKKERQIVDLVVRGLLDKEICRELEISANTLRTYWSRIRTKLGNHTRSRLSAEYVAAGLLFPVDPDLIRTRSPDRQLASSEWYKDMRADMTFAGDHINQALGLEPGVPHPSAAYGNVLHPGDVEEVMRVYLNAVSNRLSSFAVTHRCAKGHLVTSHYTFAEIEYDGNEPVVVRGHTVMINSSVLLSHVRVGLWSQTHPQGALNVDNECRKLLGLEGLAKIEPEDLLQRVFPSDRPQLLSFFDHLFGRSEGRHRAAVRLMEGVHPGMHVQFHAHLEEDSTRAVGSIVAIV